MAERRMFTTKITDSSDFISMPSSTQALYFHLNLASDDDGFCNEVNLCIYKAKASTDDLKILIAKRFILTYEESSVIVIKHWRMNNLLRKDRYKETQYKEEKDRLYVKDNGVYTFDSNQGKKLENHKEKPKEIEIWQPNGNQMAPKDSIGKDSIVEYSIDKNSLVKDNKENKREKEKEENNARTRVSFNSNNLNIKDRLNHAISFNNDLNELIQLKYECMKINNDDIDDELANLYNELLTKIANIKVQNSKNNHVVEQPTKDAYSCIKADDELPF